MSEYAMAYIIDADPGIREMISRLLRNARISSQAYSTAMEFLAASREPHPCCLVFDDPIPDFYGLNLIQQIRNQSAQMPFILTTSQGTVPLTVAAMKLGAFTVLEKPFDPNHLIALVRDMLEIEHKKRLALQQQEQVVERIKLLTEREREVAELVIAGNKTKNIANLLQISVKTVDVHRSHISKKLGVESVAQMVNLILRSRFRPDELA